MLGERYLRRPASTDDFSRGYRFLAAQFFTPAMEQSRATRPRVVTSPPGREIPPRPATGRVGVQFHWDHQGQGSDKTVLASQRFR